MKRQKNSKDFMRMSDEELSKEYERVRLELINKDREYRADLPAGSSIIGLILNNERTDHYKPVLDDLERLKAGLASEMDRRGIQHK